MASGAPGMLHKITDSSTATGKGVFHTVHTGTAGDLAANSPIGTHTKQRALWQASA